VRKSLLLMVMFFSAGTALAQSATPTPLKNDVPLDAYMDALARISPAAREGATTYLDAFRRRCGRPLKTVELRQAIAEGVGDPVLMAMMRAAFQRDPATLQHLSDSVSCVRGK
jgi:hypothetical protein